ncbi:MAG: UMP kinase [Deltaproteobacteria bacterium]|nr:UMP kinase [Deltaproteobacteria bacterium]MCB9488488.1 UMP kinase [Deltaproteobacteria bacterium]
MADGSVPRRVLLKLSGEALMGQSAFGIDPDVLRRVAGEIKTAVDKGIQVAIVVGGGNFFRGVAVSSQGMDRAAADTMGMLATVMNGLAMSDVLTNMGVVNRVMTAISMDQVAEPYIRKRAMHHLSRGQVTIFVAGTGSPYFTTDTAAALRAAEIGADVFFKATKVDGVYDSDPKTNPDAKFFERLTFDECISRQLGVMDTTAMALCRENKTPIVVFNMAKDDNIARALVGERLGTIIEGTV